MYNQKRKFHVAVDCIIFGFDRQALKLLCVKRDFAPEKGKWSLMGGFLEQEEDIDDAAKRVLYQLTGLNEIYLEQLQAYGERTRDPAGRVISIAYYALIDSVRFDKQISRTYDARWFSLDHLPQLVFDHQAMVEKAIKRLQRKCRTQPVGFELLPEKFTLPQLQLLYEEIFGRVFDKRNFRKKILSMGILSKLEEKDKAGSRKGAYLYQFDKEKYDALMNNGFNFEI